MTNQTFEQQKKMSKLINQNVDLRCKVTELESEVKSLKKNLEQLRDSHGSELLKEIESLKEQLKED